MPLKTTPFEPEKFFTTPEAQADLLNDALESGNAGYIADALGVIARAQGISKTAKETGLSRAGLHKSLGKNGDPKLTTMLKVLGTMNFKLSATKVTPTGRAMKITRRIGGTAKRSRKSTHRAA